MIRTNRSKVASIVDVAEVSGFDLTFNYTIDDGDSKPKSVSVYGNKSGTDGMPGAYISLSGSVTSQSQNIQFTGMDFDQEIADEIIAELRVILAD